MAAHRPPPRRPPPPFLFSGPLHSIRHKFLCAAAASTIWPFLSKNYACASEFALASLTRRNSNVVTPPTSSSSSIFDISHSVASFPSTLGVALAIRVGHCAMTFDVKPFSEKVKVSRASRYDQGYLVTLIARQSLSSPSRQKRK